jgi:hypothetical protein
MAGARSWSLISEVEAQLPADMPPGTSAKIKDSVNMHV